MATIAEKLAEAAVTDSFNRTENPLSDSGKWAVMNPGTTTGRCQTGPNIGWLANTLFSSGEDDAYWTPASFAAAGDQYIYGIFTLTRIGGNERQTGVWLCRDKSNPKETQNGYRLRLEKKAGAGEVKFMIEKVVGGEVTELTSLTTTEYVVGSKIALVLGGGKLYMFASVTEGGEFVEKLSVADTTFTEGYSGVRAKGTGEFIIKDFRTGTFTLEVVRQFSSSPSSQILTAVGSLAEGGHTLVAIVRYEADGCFIGTVNEANEDVTGPQLAINLGGLLGWSREGVSPMKPTKEKWSLVAATKAAGTATPRLHLYDFDTKTWSHVNGTSTSGEGSIANWNRFRIGGKTSAVGPYKGAMAAVAMYNQVLTDEQIENLITAGSIGAWAGLSPAPAALWEFNQQSVAEEVQDLIGTADQVSREETTVRQESPPIPYGTLGVGKFIKLLIGGAIKEVKRWILVGGELKNV